MVRLWSASVSLSTQYETIVSNTPENKIFYRGESAETRNGINYRESSYLPSSISANGQLSFQGFYKLELKGKVLAEEVVSVSETLDPFETIGLVFLSPPANDILGSAGTGKLIALPAIAYHFYDTKAWTNAEQKTAVDIVQLASVAAALGEIHLAKKAWRVWLAWGDLAVNAPDFVLKNEQVRQQILALPGGGEVLFYWDRCVLIANGVYLSPFAYQFARGLVSSSIRLGAKLPEIIGKQWQDIVNLFTKLDEGYELGLIGKIAKKGSKLVKQINLGKYVGKKGAYEIYEDGEIFFRSISKNHYDELIKANRMPGTGECTTSPNKAFSGDYSGYLVKFKVKTGTIDELKAIGVTDGNPLVKAQFGEMPTAKDIEGSWNLTNARFKVETLNLAQERNK